MAIVLPKMQMDPQLLPVAAEVAPLVLDRMKMALALAMLTMITANLVDHLVM